MMKYSIFILFFSLFLATVGLSYDKKVPYPHPLPASKQTVDPFLEKLWYLNNLNVFEAWKVTKGSASSLIAIIDSGVDYTSPDLFDSLWWNVGEVPRDKKDNDQNGKIDDVIGWNWEDEMALPYDDNGHGTFIAGIIAAQADNGFGGVGICPQCKIMPLRFSNSEGFGDTEDAIAAFKYALEKGARIINYSFASDDKSYLIRNVIREAAAADVLVVVSAGNDGNDADKKPLWPASFNEPNMIVVGSTTPKNNWSTISNFSPTRVHVGAPGFKIYGPWADGKWYYANGTSFSAPMVAAVAGLVLSVNPKLKATEVKQILIDSCRKVPALEDRFACGGIVDAEKAVKLALSRNQN
jgi:subtilisin family serine protease